MVLALDASSPAIVYTEASATVTTASFTPPSGSRMVAMLANNTGSGNTPVSPTIGDSIGSITWTQQEWQGRPEGTTADGMTAIWTAVGTGAAMTVATSHSDPATGSALKVMVFTDTDGGTPGVGAVVETSSVSASTTTAISLTATVTNSRAVMVYSDWSAQAAATAGANTTLTGGGSAAAGAITYAFALQSTNGGVSGASTTLNLSHGSANSRRWAAIEITPTATAVSIPILVMSPLSRR